MNLIKSFVIDLVGIFITFAFCLAWFVITPEGFGIIGGIIILVASYFVTIKVKKKLLKLE
ncbi:hypothetical protein CKY02_12680 [Photorhabdus bodei]|uniref:Uncharacterized protein n=1 Tax=Photorhabdus bodei TaxID=2029681 RepID=A0A329X791_9GAMM|nr:hypothetical protein CKY02_12680 [Photorhabdus bodei]